MLKRIDNFCLITAGDSQYFLSILNLIGSVQKNSDIFSSIVVYDIGLAGWQKRFLNQINGVSVQAVAAFAPHWQACWSWKPWIWSNAPQDKVLYLDAGVEVLRSLSPISQIIDANGYFLVSQNTTDGSHFLQDIMPANYFSKFKIPTDAGQKDVVAAGIMGFSKGSDFFAKVVLPTLAAVKRGDNLGWSKSESDRNRGIHYLVEPPERDCPVFRHDQTVLNALVYHSYPQPVVQPLETYAEFRAADFSPGQLLWHHRRQSQLTWISSVQYRHYGVWLRIAARLLWVWRQIKRRITRRQLP